MLIHNPHANNREISRDLRLSNGSIHKILTDFNMHPYHIVLHQALLDSDFDTRLNYCHWLLNMIRDDRHFLDKVLWTDEASFTSNGRVNLYNMHYWCDNNPHWMREVDHQHRWTVNVWCGIVEGKIIGPFIFDRTLNTFNF